MVFISPVRHSRLQLLLHVFHNSPSLVADFLAREEYHLERSKLRAAQSVFSGFRGPFPGSKPRGPLESKAIDNRCFSIQSSLKNTTQPVTMTKGQPISRRYCEDWSTSNLLDNFRLMFHFVS